MTEGLRETVRQELAAFDGRVRLTALLSHLGVSTSTWYRRPKVSARGRSRPRAPLDPAKVETIRGLCRR